MKTDTMMQVHSAQENPYLQEIYKVDIDREKAHELFHTQYKNRKRITGEEFVLEKPAKNAALHHLNICFGTSCFIRGAQDLYAGLMTYVKGPRYHGQKRNSRFSFCSEQCGQRPRRDR